MWGEAPHGGIGFGGGCFVKSCKMGWGGVGWGGGCAYGYGKT